MMYLVGMVYGGVANGFLVPTKTDGNMRSSRQEMTPHVSMISLYFIIESTFFVSCHSFHYVKGNI